MSLRGHLKLILNNKDNLTRCCRKNQNLEYRSGWLPLTLKCVKANHQAFNYYVSHNWEVKKEEMGAEGVYYLMKYEGLNNRENYGAEKIKSIRTEKS